MDSRDKLERLFAMFPGIGPRQAKRFVYFLLTRNSGFTSELALALSDLKKHSEARFPKQGREKFSADSPHLIDLREILKKTLGDKIQEKKDLPKEET